MSTLIPRAGGSESLDIGSYNIQRTKQLSIVARLAAEYDVFFIQEFEATKKRTEAMEDFARRAGRRFFTSPSRNGKVNLTGIFINPKTITVLGMHELHAGSHSQRYSTDIRVRTKNEDHVVFQNFYLPSAQKAHQASIVEETMDSFEDLKRQHRALKIFYGGDLNNSVEEPAVSESEALLAIGELNRLARNEDVAAYDPDIAIAPTNRSVTCRRLDRFYAPRKWKKRAMRYQITKPLGVNSSHNMIVVRYLLDLSNGVQVDRPRFQYPLHRMQPPFNEARTWDIPADTNIDEAIELIQGDGYEYISLMGFLRKTDPGMVRYLLQNDSEESEGRSKYKAAQLFFQAKKPEQVIFTSLKNEALVLRKLCGTT
ncbi:hypothetical protein HF325_003565 [Metschnikowia pulcherrima]|uniref:Endonuclease/exonuclease/phosphatase domain-containing protein n=1 Tax=Metschnikowia pulcherrima TaxID=27326 RepID=A0A8H7GRX2_9ASCO|nr:hypothetical protein HF325_003565 [Metschnikowia pulcherrima]